MVAKPTKIPRWADTGVIVEPSEAKKDSGWVAPELPPDTFFNWHQNLIGGWMTWLGDRLFDNGAEENFQIKATSGASDGGELRLEGGVAGAAVGDGGDVRLIAEQGGATSGAGGQVVVFGGSGTGGGNGGNITMLSGSGNTSGSIAMICNPGVIAGGNATLSAGSASAGNGGAASIAGGSGTVVGGTATVGGGNCSAGEGGPVSASGGNSAGTDENGGNASISGGRSTGSGSSKTSIMAAVAGASGTTQRIEEDFFVADGLSGENQAKRLFRGEQGIAADGVTSNIDGSGLLGRGLTAGAALGTPETNLGTGLHGRGSDGSGAGNDGYGVVAEANATTPDRTSLRIVPQSADSLTPQRGDFIVDDANGVARIYNGAEFARQVGQVKVNSAANTLAGATGVFNPFTQKYTIPANTLKVGSVIRVRAAYRITTLGFVGTTEMRITANGTVIYDEQTVTAESLFSGAIVDMMSTVRAIGNGTTEFATSAIFVNTPSDSEAFLGLVSSLDSTIPIDIELKLDLTTGNIADLYTFVVDIT